MGKGSHSSYHFMTDIARKLVSWALIWVSHPFILSSSIHISHSMIVMILCNPNISITLWHATHSIMLIVSVVSSSYTNSLQHRVSVLVCNSIFCHLKFLIFNEISVSSVHLHVWAIVSTMRVYLLCILFSVSLNQFLIFVTLSFHSSNENDIALVDSSIIWAAMRSLFVISSICLRGRISFILYSNWISTHILRRLIEIEKTRSLAICSSNIPKLMWVCFSMTATISQKWIIIGVKF